MSNQNNTPNDAKIDFILKLINGPEPDKYALPIKENDLQNNFSKIEINSDGFEGMIPIIEKGQIKTRLKIMKHPETDEWVLPITGEVLSVLTKNQIFELGLQEYKENYFSKRKELCITSTFGVPKKHPQKDKWVVSFPEEISSNYTDSQRQKLGLKDAKGLEELNNNGWNILNLHEEIKPVYQLKYIDAEKAFEIEKRLNGLIHDWKTGYNYFCTENFLRAKLQSSLKKLFSFRIRFLGKAFFSNDFLKDFLWNQVLAYEELVYVYLGRIFDRHRNVDSLWKLLKFFEEYPNDFMFATADTIKDSVKKDKELLNKDNEISRTIKKIQKIRHKYIAHSDKTFRNIDRAHQEIKVNLSEISQIFKFVHSRINKYSLYFNNQEVNKEPQKLKPFKKVLDLIIKTK